MEMSLSVFNFGVMVGAIIFTAMADKLGRKPIHLACTYCMLALGIGIAFAPNYITYVVLRFFLGAVREVNLRLTGSRNQYLNFIRLLDEYSGIFVATFNSRCTKK